MKIKLLGLVFYIISSLVVSSTVLGQLVSLSKQSGITGLSSPSVLGNFVLAKEVKNIRIEEVGIIIINSEASNISVEVSDVSRNEIPISLIDKNTYIIQFKGKVWIEVLCVDFEKNIFAKDKKTIELNTNPDNPDTPDNPTPNPDLIPEDSFNNIGRRVNEWTKGLSNKIAVSNAFIKGKEFLTLNPGATVSEATKLVADILVTIPEYKNYSEFSKKLNEDLSSRWPMSKGVLANYWNCVSLGLNPKSSPSNLYKQCPNEDCVCDMHAYLGGAKCECQNPCKCGEKK